MVRPTDTRASESLDIDDSDFPDGFEDTRRQSYIVGDPSTARELIKFLNCKTIDELKKLTVVELLAACGQGSATISTWESEIVGLQEQVASLEEQLVAKNTIIGYLQDRGINPAVAPAKSTKLPDPEVFEGNKGPKFEEWVSKMRKKLKANKDHYPTPELQMGYVEIRVGGEAIKHLAPRLRDQATNPFTTAEEMFKTLERAFLDPNRKQTTIVEFRKLYQNSKPFHEFWAEFQRLAAEIEMPVETQQDELRLRVSRDVQTALASVFDITDVYELAQKCMVIDNNLSLVKQSQKGSPGVCSNYARDHGRKGST
jgi:hypothetical protein